MNKRSYYPFLVHCYYGKSGTGKSYYEMQQELKRLKESEEYYRKGFIELHKRIDETIEYIETYKESFKNYIASDLEFNVYKVLEILKGGSK